METSGANPSAGLRLLGAGNRGLSTSPIFCSQALAVGDLCLYIPPPADSRGLPLRIGRVLRLVSEYNTAPFCIVDSYWPMLKTQKFGDKLNLYGTWVRASQPIDVDAGVSKKKRKTTVQHCLSESSVMVDMNKILVWPVTLDKGALGEKDALGFGSLRIPFDALMYCRKRFPELRLTRLDLCFSERSKEFLAVLSQQDLTD